MVGPVVVPHDGTEMSDRALEKGIKLAKAFGSELILVHVVDSRFVPPSTTLALLGDGATLEDAKGRLLKILKTGAEAMLKVRIEKARANGLPARFVLAVGSPADEIVAIANRQSAEMIVIGSRQLKGGKLLTLGSVARRVSEIADCPVMIER